MIPDGLELLKNMNDVATCNISQFIKASAKCFMFKDLESSSIPGGLHVMSFMGFIGDADISFSAKKYDL